MAPPFQQEEVSDHYSLTTYFGWLLNCRLPLANTVILGSETHETHDLNLLSDGSAILHTPDSPRFAQKYRLHVNSLIAAHNHKEYKKVNRKYARGVYPQDSLRMYTKFQLSVFLGFLLEF
jgi:hypothetical protein